MKQRRESRVFRMLGALLLEFIGLMAFLGLFAQSQMIIPDDQATPPANTATWSTAASQTPPSTPFDPPLFGRSRP